MIGLILVSLGLSLIPSLTADAELSELLERGKEASYSAEQMISCATPDGSRDALVRIEQTGPEIMVGSGFSSDTAVAIGAGGWMLIHQDGVVDEARVASAANTVEPLYQVEEMGDAGFMGRAAAAYRLHRDGVLRAELVVDDETGVLVRAVTYDAAGEVYCLRRFISFEPGDPPLHPLPQSDRADLTPLETDDHRYPEEVAGFTRLDQYEDSDGFDFTYYSDGLFSFAVFQTPVRVNLPEATEVGLGGAPYLRSFTAGQVIYVWETRSGGMALVGDLPPDLHDTVLTAFPSPHDPGLFRKIWRTLFG